MPIFPRLSSRSDLPPKNKVPSKLKAFVLLDVVIALVILSVGMALVFASYSNLFVSVEALPRSEIIQQDLRDFY